MTIRRDIIRPLVEFNYGSEANIPFFGFDCHEVEDQKEVVEIYKTLACDMGLEIPKSHIYKKFNIPKVIRIYILIISKILLMQFTQIS